MIRFGHERIVALPYLSHQRDDGHGAIDRRVRCFAEVSGQTLRSRDEAEVPSGIREQSPEHHLIPLERRANRHDVVML